MDQKHKLARTAGLISIFTMVSRIFGYVRDGLGGAILGAGFANDAYLAAFRIPNLFRDLFAEGALSSAFIPTFTNARLKESSLRAWQLASVVINTIIILMLLLILIGEAGAPWIVKAIVPGFAGYASKLELTIPLPVSFSHSFPSSALPRYAWEYSIQIISSVFLPSHR